MISGNWKESVRWCMMDDNKRQHKHTELDRKITGGGTVGGGGVILTSLNGLLHGVVKTTRLQ